MANFDKESRYARFSTMLPARTQLGEHLLRQGQWLPF
jgi:hypothetical protein